MNAKATELLNNEEFLKKVLPMEAEDAQKAFAAEGAEITVEELNEIAAEVNKVLARKNDGELTDVDLEAVAGGKKNTTVFLVGVAVGIAIVCAPW